MKGLARGHPVQHLGRAPASSRDPAAASTPIHRVPYHGVPNVLQMNPDLVGSAGMQLQPEQVYHIEAGNDARLGPGHPTEGRDAHALPVLGMPCDRCLDPGWTGVEMAPRQSGVAPAHPAGGQGSTQAPVGQIGLGHQHESRGVPVQPMDDAGPPLGPSSQRGAARDQGVDEGVIPMAGCRVNYQAGRLVDDGKVLVLENERERDGGGSKRTGWFVVGDLNGYDLAPDQEA